MTFEAFARALSACNLLPDALLQNALDAGQRMDDKARTALLQSMQQEYAQYVPLVQRKLERMENAIAEAQAKQYSARVPHKNHSQEAAIVRQINGMLS
jgi:hypothetical protein